MQTRYRCAQSPRNRASSAYTFLAGSPVRQDAARRKSAVWIALCLGSCLGCSETTPSETVIADAGPAETSLDAAAEPEAAAPDVTAEPEAALPDVVVEPACQPTTCTPTVTCGTISDGCGAVINCGACTAPKTCAGGGSENVCGQAFYIAPTGSDTNQGTIDSPWLTYGFASSHLTPGDAILALGGTYDANQTLQHGDSWSANASGTAQAPIRFAAASSNDRPVFDGLGTAYNFMWINGQVSWLVIDGLTFKGFSNHQTGTLLITGAIRSLVIQNCIFQETGDPNATASDHHIYAAGNLEDLIVRRNQFIRPPGAAIIISDEPKTHGVLIENNLFIGGTYGVQFADRADDLHVYNNTFFDTEYAVDLGDHSHNYGVTSVRVFNNIGYAKQVALVIGSTNLQSVTEDYNLWYTSSGTPVSYNGQLLSVSDYAAATHNAQHSVQGDPMFVNSSLPDLRLKPGSPGVDTGTDIGTKDDFTGALRPQGAAVDMGAYER
jgi:hypothetical protein